MYIAPYCKMRLAIVIPALNEAGAIGQTLDAISKLDEPVELVCSCGAAACPEAPAHSGHGRCAGIGSVTQPARLALPHKPVRWGQER